MLRETHSVSNTRVVTIDSNETLFTQGDESRDLYIIRSGSVRVSTASDGVVVPIAVLGPGSIVGEMSFISGNPRSATVTALEPTTASLVSVDVLDSGPFGIDRWAVNIAQVVADRIRRTTRLIGEYRSLNANPEEEAYAEPTDDLGFRDETSDKQVAIYLRGTFDAGRLNELKKVLRSYASRGFERASIDFADVPDVDHDVLAFFRNLADDERAYSITVSIKNVQLIRNRIQTIEGIERIVEQSHLPIVRVTRGEYLIRQDEPGDDMFVVKTGRLVITRTVDEDEIILGYADTGDVIGEMNLVTEGNRSANVRAERTSTVFRISAREFNRNSYRIPGWFMEIVRVLIYRLRHTNELLEREIQRQSVSDESPDEAVPICIQMDSAKPDTIVLRKDVIEGNLEFLAAMVNVLIRRGHQRLTIDLRETESIDHAAIRYLLELHVLLQKRGGFLTLKGQRKEILRLVKQYNITLPTKEERPGSP